MKGSRGVTLTADIGGDPSDPCALLLHRGGETRHSWARTARALEAAGRHVIALDQRGHGESDRAPDKDYSLDAYVDDVLTVIEGLPGAPAIVGSMLGGLIGLTAIGEKARRGENVAGALVLVDAAPTLSVEARRRLAEMIVAAPDGFETIAAASDYVAAHRPDDDWFSTEPALRRVLRQGADGRWRWAVDPAVLDDAAPKRFSVERDRERLAEAARHVGVPTLLVRGGVPGAMQAEDVARLQDAIPQAELADLSHDEAPVEEIIISFLEKVMRRPSHRPPTGGVDPKTLRQAMGCFGTGVTVVTTMRDDGEPVGLTANSFTSVSLQPPLVLFCIDKSASSLPAFQGRRAFAVNILHTGQRETSARFATRGADRFGDTAWEVWELGVPILQDSMASLECELVETVDAGDHQLVIGRVRRVWFDPSRDPLLYFQGSYRSIHIPTRDE